MKRHLIPADVLQALINYLATRPYSEVHQIIPMLEALPLADEPEPECPTT